MAKKAMGVEEIGDLFKQQLSRATLRPSVHGYKPHEKQLIFHKSTARIILYIGGNRSGKTVGGSVEDIYRLRGNHPYKKVPPAPVRGRIVTPSYTEGVKEIIIPEFQKWLPPSDLINGSWEDSYSKQERKLTMANGSTCEFMSYDQKLEKFAGTSRHFVHFDEEPPWDIYKECRMRVLDTAGDMYITMTPVEGMTWVYDELYLKGISGESPNIFVLKIDTEENPYLSSAEVEAVFEDMDEDDIKKRKHGDFIQVGGLVFKKFNPNVHVIDPLTEDKMRQIFGWTHYASMDHGYNNPTAWLWHAVSPTGLVITYDELYDREKIVKYYADQIKSKNVEPGRHAPQIYVGDPAIEQRQAVTGDSIRTTYMQNGIPLILGNNDVKIGIEKMNRYFEQGKWVITENCHNLIRELQRVRWKTFDSAKKRHDNNQREEIHKHNDHAPDSARYFFSLMPDLRIPDTPNRPGPEVSLKEAVQQAVGAVTVTQGPIYIDENLTRSPQNTEWSYVDEHMGGLC